MIKEILVLHHSHLDIGYTHPQPLLMELQKDYIENAIVCCEQTEDWAPEEQFRWTCEATLPVMQWLETASAESVAKFEKFLHNGQISITAMPFHAAPTFTAEQMIDMFKPVKYLRERFGIPLKTAISHDVDGQPWSVSQMLLDIGVEFYITGVNLHFGGIPFPRPQVFNWRTADGRNLPTFLGEHYSVFSQYTRSYKKDTALMREGIDEYIASLEENGYPYDFVYLTATNPPMYDNNTPDPALAEVFRKFNSEGHPYKIRFTTPELLFERVKKVGELPSYGGDWTDFWNFGAGSAARELKTNRGAKKNIKTAEVLEAFQGSVNDNHKAAKKEAVFHANAYEEHTWGSNGSVGTPDSEDTYSQFLHKAELAYKAADLSAYCLSGQLEKLAKNPIQWDGAEGILAVNPTGNRQKVELMLPEIQQDKRKFSARNAKYYVPYMRNILQKQYCGTVDLEPFSYKKITLAELNRLKEEKLPECVHTAENGIIETPFYRLQYDTATGRILSLKDLVHDWEMLDISKGYTFFECITERVEPAFHKPDRGAIYTNNVWNRNHNISNWNKDWKAKREHISEVIGFEVVEEANAIVYILKTKTAGISYMEQHISFSKLHNRISMNVTMNKEDVREPEGIYFTFPLNLDSGWECTFDTAGRYVRLDEDQLGECSKDFVTVDKTVSVYDEKRGVTLACPDAPLVQVGGFNFGKESKTVERIQNPLLLAWPMNNYWDTNFCASQPGVVSLSYELVPFEEFNVAEAEQAGIAAQNACELNLLSHCSHNEEGSFMKFEGGENVKIQHIRNAGENDILVMLNNIGNEEQPIAFSFTDKTIAKAYSVNPLEEIQDEMIVNNGRVELNVPPQSFFFVKVIRKI